MVKQRGRFAPGIAALAALITAGACASAPRQQVELPPQTLTDAPTSTAVEEQALVAPDRGTPRSEPAATAAGEPAAAEPTSEARRGTVLIQRGGSLTTVTPRTLYEASSAERERRAGAEAPVAVITNQNLAEQAKGGQLSVVGGPAESPAPAGGAAAAGTVAAEGAEAAGTATPSTEEYWRGQALKIRLDWKAAVESVDELAAEAEELRRRFYEEDDPFYRDNQIKPAWDRALDLLTEAKASAEEHERRLSRFLEEGRRAGALPGWLREGMEFEPPPTPDRTPAGRRRTDDPWEPRVLGEDDRDP